MTETIGIAVVVVCALLGWAVWRSKSEANGRVYQVTPYECWYYDALGCRIDCGVITAPDKSALESYLSKRFGKWPRLTIVHFRRVNGSK